MGGRRVFKPSVLVYLCAVLLLAFSPRAIAAKVAPMAIAAMMSPEAKAAPRLCDTAEYSTKIICSPHPIETSLEKLVGFIENHIRPSMQKAYRAYYDKVGSQISSLIWAYIDKRELTKIDFQNVKARYPAAAKRAYESSVYGLYQLLESTPIEAINGSLQVSFDILGHAGRAVSAEPLQTPEDLRLQQIVTRLRPYMLDPGMRSCLRGHIIDVPIDNAFNTGCHIFVTRDVVENLSEDELAAVIAHEMGHSARGDGLDNFLAITQSGVEQSGLLLLDEAYWFLTGENYEHMKAVQSGEFLDLILRSFGEQADKIELMADLMGVKLLKRVGLSEEHLVSALIRLTSGRSGAEGEKAVRQYPSLQKRVETIRAYAQQLE